MNPCAEQLPQKFQSDCNQQLAACYLRSYAGKARKLARSKALKGKPRISTTLDRHANALAKVADMIVP